MILFSLSNPFLVVRKFASHKLLNSLSVLNERERIIIEDYFGLSGTPRTLEDIGNDFGLTKERVRQIKERSLRVLRNNSKELFDYL